jgi:hypothetical protein
VRGHQPEQIEHYLAIPVPGIQNGGEQSGVSFAAHSGTPYSTNLRRRTKSLSSGAALRPVWSSGWLAVLV